MQQAATLTNIIHQSLLDFAHISEADWSSKPDPHRWSKREILGHLIDSASNNLRRFVVTQYAQNTNIVYYQNEWVQLQGYQQADTQEIIELWKLLNLQIAKTIRNIPTEKLQYTCDTGKTGVELHTLAFLIDDYVGHLQHHLGQIMRKTV